MIPYTNEHGHRDYRADVGGRDRARWPWLLVLALVAAVLIRACR